MRGGRLRHPIVIERNAGTTTDAAGEIVADWRRVARVRAAINPGRGREYEVARQMHADLTHLLTIRADRRLSVTTLPRRRVVHRGRVLDILHAVDKDERGRELLLTCRENMHP